MRRHSLSSLITRSIRPVPDGLVGAELRRRYGLVMDFDDRQRIAQCSNAPFQTWPSGISIIPRSAIYEKVSRY